MFLVINWEVRKSTSLGAGRSYILLGMWSEIFHQSLFQNKILSFMGWGVGGGGGVEDRSQICINNLKKEK